MLTVNLHITEGPISRHLRVRATSLARAMEIAGRSRPGVHVRLAGPVAPVAMAAGKGVSAAGESTARAA